MRAVVIATGQQEVVTGIKSRRALPLLPCVDRPALQHVVEMLVEQGVTEFEFVLSEAPEEIEAFLGDGQRWGSSFSFQLARNAEQPYRVVKLQNQTGSLLLVHADCLPNLPAGELAAAVASPGVLYCTEAKPESTPADSWTGWALLSPELIASLPTDLTKSQLAQFLFENVQADGLRFVSEAVDLGSLKGIIQAQQSLMTGTFAGLHLSARQIEPGVWVSRNVVIHPTATLTTPLFIGENSRIGAGTRIGPNAVIGHDTVIDRHTTVQNSAVAPGSYCGEGLELDHVYIDKNRLIDISLDTEVHVSDSFILGTMKKRISLDWAVYLVTRCVAVCLLLLTLPLLLLVWLMRRNSFSKRRVVQLPVPSNTDSWREFSIYSFCRPDEKLGRRGLRPFLFEILPNLIQVIRGKIRLIGVKPRSLNEIKQLPEDWRALYLQSRPGLITEAGVLHGSDATEDEVYSSEVYYSAMASLSYDFSLAMRFLGQAVWIV